MPGQRRSNLVRSRRRVEDEGEEESGLATEAADDSHSDVSVLTNDAGGDADDSDLSGSDTKASPALRPVKEKVDAKDGPEANASDPVQPPKAPVVDSGSFFETPSDTVAMMNGLSIGEEAVKGEAVEFEALGQPVDTTAGSQEPARNETPADRRRREHEDYKKRRDADPAFIPNRGAFFMHDQRNAGAAQNSNRPLGRGRGRGRGIVGGPFSPANLMAHAVEATNDPWKHDLHETVNQPSQHFHLPNQAVNSSTTRVSMPPNPPQAASGPKAEPPNRTFSSTKQIGKIQIRVLLPDMKAPVTFSEVPVRQYVRLPNHRPPLRRDKPVRISMPEHPIRYIFPAIERSFIFIPRAQRPNQQAFGVRGRGRHFGSVGGYSSRRTSAYGGSVYSPSVGMSRRSSNAGQYGRDGIISPAGSVLARPPPIIDTGRPIVRLPPGSQQHTPTTVMSGSGTPIVGMIPPQNYPLPQKPQFRENWPGQLPMHQPKPQKNVSVSGIESPESLSFHAPQPQEQQPFHNQIPAHMEQRSEDVQHSRQGSFAGQPSVGTPLSNIPERAIHAQPFQPFQPGVFQPGYPVQPTYFYPPPAGQAHYANGMPTGAIIAPMFIPGGQNGTYMAVPTAMPAPAAAPAAGVAGPGSGQQVPYENNGMVFYIDPSQQQQHQHQHQHQQQQQHQAAQSMEGMYAMPGMGGMMTPTPDGSYYYPQMAQGAVFYPQQ